MGVLGLEWQWFDRTLEFFVLRFRAGGLKGILCDEFWFESVSWGEFGGEG